MARVATALMLSLLTLVLVGCGGSSFEGDWSVDNAALKAEMLATMEKEAEGETDEMKKMMQEMATGMADAIKMNLSLKADKTFVVTTEVMGQTDTTTGTWSAEGGTLTMTEENDATMQVTGTLEDGKLMLSFPSETGGPERLPMVRAKK